MTDLNKQELRRLAENAAFMHPTFAENADAASLFDPVSGPDVVLALLDEIDLLRHGVKGDFDLDAWVEWAKGAANLRAELEGLRQDAGRYRWLREQEAEHGVSVVSISQWLSAATCVAVTFVDGSFVDHAIDAAMAKELSHD